MAITIPAAKAEFNRILNNLVAIRDAYNVYGDDWPTLPTGVKNAVKARVADVLGDAGTDLSALSTEIQGQ